MTKFMMMIVFTAVVAEYPEPLEDFAPEVESAIKSAFLPNPEPILFFGNPGAGKTVVLRLMREMNFRLHNRRARSSVAKATAKSSTVVIAPTKVTGGCGKSV